MTEATPTRSTNETSGKPSVLFVCVHNAGRSQMAAGYLQHLAGDRVAVLSAGSEPADLINPVAVQAMAEDGWVRPVFSVRACPCSPMGTLLPAWFEPADREDALWL